MKKTTGESLKGVSTCTWGYPPEPWGHQGRRARSPATRGNPPPLIWSEHNADKDYERCHASSWCTEVFAFVCIACFRYHKLGPDFEIFLKVPIWAVFMYRLPGPPLWLIGQVESKYMKSPAEEPGIRDDLNNSCFQWVTFDYCSLTFLWSDGPQWASWWWWHLPALAGDLLVEGGVVVGSGGEHRQRDVCSLMDEDEHLGILTKFHGLW